MYSGTVLQASRLIYWLIWAKQGIKGRPIDESCNEWITGRMDLIFCQMQGHVLRHLIRAKALNTNVELTILLMYSIVGRRLFIDPCGCELLRVNWKRVAEKYHYITLIMNEINSIHRIGSNLYAFYF